MAGVARRRRRYVSARFALRSRAVVAACAGPGGHAAVAETRRYPCRGAVAGIARDNRGDVGRRLPGGIHTVVAGRACSRCNTLMAKPRRLPRDSAMAAVAGGRGSHVPCGLCTRHRAIMASTAGTHCHVLVAESRRLPRDGAVTAIAGCTGRNMALRFGSRGKSVAVRVANRALGGRAAKHIVDMTRLAARVPVRTGEWKSRLQMIESKLAGRFFGRVRRSEHEQQHARKANQCKNHVGRPRPPPSKR